MTTATPTATATATALSVPLLAGLADLLTKARRPLLAGMASGDRDRQRLLADLRALPDSHADVAYRVRV